MKRVSITMLMIVVLVAAFSGIAFSGGAPNPGSTCDLLYHPAKPVNLFSGIQVSGTFIGWETTEADEDVIAVRVILGKDKEWHAFEFSTGIGAGICDPGLTDDELLQRMSLWPCMMDIQQDFFPYPEWTNFFPYLFSIRITGRDCTPPPGGAIYSSSPTISGVVTVKLVPIKW